MKSKLLIVACLIIVLSMALILPLSIVNADYSDIVNDPNSIVNFNQQILLDSSPYNTITIINGQGFNFDTYSLNSYINFRAQIYSNHKYYCYISSPITSNIEFTVNGVPLIVVNAQYGIYTPNQSGLCDRLYLISGFTAGTYYINLIDLTQMFGDNEPNLTQCQELFVADYYSYNTGSPMYFNSVNAYNQGVRDTLGSTTYDVVLNDFYNNSFGVASLDSNYNTQLVKNSPYTISGQTIFGLSASNVSWSSGASYINNDGLLSAIGFNINNVVPIGSTLNIKFQGYSLANNYNDTSSTNIYRNLYLATFNGTSFTKFLDLGSGLMSVSDYRDFSVSAPSSAENLYLISNGTINCTYLSVNVQYTNSDVLIDSIYKSGQDSIYSLYQVGGDNYQAIWQAGYTNGLNTSNPYTFANLMSSVVEAPLNAVLSMFNFDFLGYNFRNVITLILTLCIILAIIRLFIGIGGSD